MYGSNFVVHVVLDVDTLDRRSNCPSIGALGLASYSRWPLGP